jgi:hypothetical protein
MRNENGEFERSPSAAHLDDQEGGRRSRRCELEALPEGGSKEARPPDIMRKAADHEEMSKEVWTLEGPALRNCDGTEVEGVPK